MSNRAIDWVMEQQIGDVKAKFVLLCLANHSNGENVCWPAIKKLVAATEMSESTVRRKIQFLRVRGFIQITPQRGLNNRQRENIYRILREGVTAMTPSPVGVSDNDRGGGVTAMTGEGVSLLTAHKENPHKEPPEGTKEEAFRRRLREGSSEEGWRVLQLGGAT